MVKETYHAIYCLFKEPADKCHGYFPNKAQYSDSKKMWSSSLSLFQEGTCCVKVTLANIHKTASTVYYGTYKRHFNECQPDHGFIVTSLTFTTR